MIFKESLVKIVDNSGALLGKCIHLYEGNFRQGSSVGNKILVTVRKVVSNKNIKKGQLHKGIIVRVKKEVCRKDGTVIKCSDNAIVLINDKNSPLGTRVYGPVFKEVKEKGFAKIASISEGIV